MRFVLVLFALTSATAASAQAPPRVDFARDVRPIFEQHCYTCHGPDQQMSGFRLDRRADALRGGTQTNIGPGNADGSRLYQRVAGTSLGTRMPPGPALDDDQVDVIRNWIDEGAVWPDAVSGEKPVIAVDPDAARLMTAIRAGDRTAIDDVLRRNARVIHARGAGGSTPLMTAALYGDAALVERLLRAGADPNASNGAGATALMWAAPDPVKMGLLLDAGADVSARSDDQQTALLITAAIVGGDAGLRELLDYGADPAVARATDPSPLVEAARVDDSAMFKTLLEYGARLKGAGAPSATFLRRNCYKCAKLAGFGDEGPLEKEPPESSARATAPLYDPGRLARPTPVGPTPATPDAIRAAVQRSLPLLQDVGISFIKQTGCVSCHHNSLVSLAVSTARAHGYTVNEAAAAEQSRTIGAYLETWRERTVQNVPIAGGVDTVSYLLFGLIADGYAPDAATDAQAMFLKRRQAADGRFPFRTLRPPIESNDVATTALTLRALQTYAPPGSGGEYQKAVDRARAWLADAEIEMTEESAFRVLGLFWSGAPKTVQQKAVRDLLARQHEDGGWGQTENAPSDAYATGEALYALGEAHAVDPATRAYRKGIEYLLRTQIEDGTWVLETRAVPIQAYFESGFPYGVNQWISAAATAWATAALAIATPR